MAGRTKRSPLQSPAAPYLFVLPFVLTFCTFTLYPMIKSILLSFYITSGPESQVFAGVENFRLLLGDPLFWKSVSNTAVYAACSVCIQLPLSLGLALLLNSSLLKARNVWRLSFFSPHLVGMVFVGVLFSLIFAVRYGLLNRLFDTILILVKHAGIDRLLGVTLPATMLDVHWLGNPLLVMPALVLTSLWMYVGFNMIYFLAALQGVEKDLYEAATIDGANAGQRFWHVTLPAIKPVALFVVVLSTIGSFQLYELPWMMLANSGGPDNAGLTVVMYLYLNGFSVGDLGYASAVAWVLALGMLAVSVGQLWVSGTFGKDDQ